MYFQDFSPEDQEQVLRKTDSMWRLIHAAPQIQCLMLIQLTAILEQQGVASVVKSGQKKKKKKKFEGMASGSKIAFSKLIIILGVFSVDLEALAERDRTVCHWIPSIAIDRLIQFRPSPASFRTTTSRSFFSECSKASKRTVCVPLDSIVWFNHCLKEYARKAFSARLATPPASSRFGPSATSKKAVLTLKHSRRSLTTSRLS